MVRLIFTLFLIWLLCMWNEIKNYYDAAFDTLSFVVDINNIKIIKKTFWKSIQSMDTSIQD